MQTPKIQFSPHEIELMTSPAWILTKNSVMQKMAEGMGSLAERMKETVSQNSERLPSVMTASNAKLSRGENYQGLPYLMLDYPRLFGKDDILAIRTFFWWGRFCSVTLHMRGRYQALICRNISVATSVLAEHEFYISKEGDEWNHDVLSNDYVRIESMQTEALHSLSRSAFIKLSSKVNLTQWNEMEDALYGLFRELLNLLVLNHD